MAIAEEIQDLNKRISGLEKKQEEVKRTLAVEEHKLSELQAQLKDEGYDVSKMSDAEIEALMDKLAESIETEMERLKGIIEEAEKHYEKFQELREGSLCGPNPSSRLPLITPPLQCEGWSRWCGFNRKTWVNGFLLETIKLAPSLMSTSNRIG